MCDLIRKYPYTLWRSPMILENYQVVNCFGFRDSGQVNLKDAKNIIYILGRNSSGKSSFLNALKYFEKDIIPKDKQNFENFNPSDDEPMLVAVFGVEEKELSFEKFMKSVNNIIIKWLQKLAIDKTVIESDKYLQSLINAISDNYEKLFDYINAKKIITIEKDKHGNYRFLTAVNCSLYDKRKKEIEKSINTLTESNLIKSKQRNRKGKPPSFHTFENLLFIQFPRILLFNEYYSLNDNLPDRITLDMFDNKDSQNQLLKSFIRLLGEDNIHTILTSNDPDITKHNLEIIQDILNTFIHKINDINKLQNNTDLLAVTLSEKHGIQITLRTDNKKSFYSHLSENTKFLFAYYLYNNAEDIQRDILLFDEPSNGFHPSAQEFILNFLISLAAEDNLVMIATHSEYLIDSMRLSGVRIMSVDNDNYMIVKNSFYNRAKEKSDYLALQPIIDAIGHKYGKLIILKGQIVITEGITDMLYLKAFNSIIHSGREINIAPARSDSHILHLIPFIISQGISFKIVIDKSEIKRIIQESFGIEDDYLLEVPPNSRYNHKSSGIEDLFSKSDFKRLIENDDDDSFYHVSNSMFVKNKKYKRVIASKFYESISKYNTNDFDEETMNNFRAVLDFCYNDNWLRM